LEYPEKTRPIPIEKIGADPIDFQQGPDFPDSIAYRFVNIFYLQVYESRGYLRHVAHDAGSIVYFPLSLPA